MLPAPTSTGSPAAKDSDNDAGGDAALDAPAGGDDEVDAPPPDADGPDRTDRVGPTPAAVPLAAGGREATSVRPSRRMRVAPKTTIPRMTVRIAEDAEDDGRSPAGRSLTARQPSGCGNASRASEATG
jgi:hypothetical protein